MADGVRGDDLVCEVPQEIDNLDKQPQICSNHGLVCTCLCACRIPVNFPEDMTSVLTIQDHEVKQCINPSHKVHDVRNCTMKQKCVHLVKEAVPVVILWPSVQHHWLHSQCHWSSVQYPLYSMPLT